MTTEAGRRLLDFADNANAAFDLADEIALTLPDIEAEAAAAERARIVPLLEALQDNVLLDWPVSVGWDDALDDAIAIVRNEGDAR